MPKLGRRSDINEWEFAGNQHVINSRAPFGNTDTPVYRVKIIGGKAINVREENSLLSGRGPTPSKGGLSHYSTPRASPARLQPLTEKPNEIHPSILQQALQHDLNTMQTYSSAQPVPKVELEYAEISHAWPPPHSFRKFYNMDLYNSHRHQHTSSLNPHKRIPPIGTPLLEDNPPMAGYGNSGPGIQQNTAHAPGERFVQKLEASNRTELSRHLPRDKYLPDRPLAYPEFTKADELELRLKIQRDLSLKFDMKALKDIYLELTGFDHHLEGYVTYRDLMFTLLKHKVLIGPETLRLVCAQFINIQDPTKVNYEKVLSYIAGSLHTPQQQPQQEQQHYYQQPTHDHQQQQSNGNFMEGDTYPGQQAERKSSAQPVAQFSNPITQDQGHSHLLGDNAKLLRLIEQQLLNADDPINFDKAWRDFSFADRERRSRLSRHQIKQLTQQCRIPLQESIMNQIIDRCESSNNQYNWEQYLNFIERVQPMQTGLRIFPNKGPKEYVKHYPEPTDDWPRNQGSESKSNQHAVPPADTSTNSSTAARLHSEYPTSNHPTTNHNNQATAGGRSAPAPVPPSYAQDTRLDDLQRKRDEAERREELQRELNRLHREYDTVRGQLKTDNEEQEPWDDRFMHLAKALYRNDTDNKGFLSRDEARWLVDKFNDTYSLNMPAADVDRAFRSSADSAGQVAINPLVKLLGMTRP